MIYEIRGIIWEVEEERGTLRVVVLSSEDSIYQAIITPFKRKIPPSAIIGYVCAELKISEDKLIWPAHVRIPEIIE